MCFHASPFYAQLPMLNSAISLSFENIISEFSVDFWITQKDMVWDIFTDAALCRSTSCKAVAVEIPVEWW